MPSINTPQHPDLSGISLTFGDEDESLDRLLRQASLHLRRNPQAARLLNDGTFELRCPIPDGYQMYMNRFAVELRVRLSANGSVFELSEQSDGLSGGWMGSCIPGSRLVSFFKAWNLQQQSVAQADLFA